ncbi:Asp-tRNA(Asn)/Glu-tRNA(Gln) amidotransferase subunit GatB [Umboniibacter marinipuniceus]|uniref:Aspartyl/glutamyl-tRNA(Asn/Gln) amidotransferase subunit B n=1 Tax=Umboniibacter marinipuniceus TaxID=569599 RepID=A0A3M0A3W0_9GAMM|nr:Asp-tRNA(Asn)/Glu-tRNA(Gln) amidotransferase subunit GatB [Umboniibacter marinipuniceus]RMA79460.1 aspartyl/glutamyl-tRNA(Asn/Gln) amidotransferase subunit B [Umboniibacter marinipuniceus]
MKWDVVIGLEIHVQLATKSKIFSGSSTQFGAAPNTQIDEVDMALPGTLPVVNRGAIEMATKFGLAIGAEIGRESVFERKNYFYADLPKGYQTTQLDKPIVGAGVVTVTLEDGSERNIRIHHAHLEEDAGKSIHTEIPGKTAIDLNRAGTPLIEIVTEPDISSAEEAVAFLRKIHSLITYIGISDGDMSQGSMRCDANVSVKPAGQEALGTRAEIKNINSFRFVEKAIKVETQRQIELIEDGGTVVQETRLYDSEKNETRSMRSKEVANDYRYFPCPDLLPIHIDDSFIEALRATLPELPDDKAERFVSDYQIPRYDALLIASDRLLSEYYEAVVEGCQQAKLAANWVMGELSAALNRDGISIAESRVSATHLAQLITRIDDGTLSSKIAKQVFETCWKDQLTPDEIIERDGLKQNSDSGALASMIDEVIANSAAQVANYSKAAADKRPKMLGYFVGQIMKASKGQANPKMVNELLVAKLNAFIEE